VNHQTYGEKNKNKTLAFRHLSRGSRYSRLKAMKIGHLKQHQKKIPQINLKRLHASSFKLLLCLIKQYLSQGMNTKCTCESTNVAVDALRFSLLQFFILSPISIKQKAS